MLHPHFTTYSSCARAVATSLAVVMASCLSLHAATKTWDITSGDGASITGGSGTWTNGGGFWNSGSADSTWSNANPDAAIFGGTAGTVTLGGPVTVGNITFNSNYTIAGGGNTLTLSSSTLTTSTNATISAILGGTTGLIKSGSGTLTLSGVNTYTGTTTINSGTLSVSAANNLGAATAAVTINGGTLHIDASGTMGTVNSTGRIVTIGASGATLDFDANQTFEGNGFTGSGAVTKTGSGTWSVSTSASTYSGAVTVSAGVLRMTAAIFTAASINVQSGGQLYILDNSNDTWNLGTSGKFTFNGDGGGTGALRQTLQSGGSGSAFTSTLGKEVVIATDSLISAETTLGTLQFSSVVSGTGTITKAGVGTLNFSGTGNTLSGGTIIQGGTITVSSGSQLGTGALTLSQTGTNSTALTLSNAAQSVGSLSSQFAATTGTISQTITLTGTALTVNQSTDGTYGTGAVSTLTSTIAGTGSLIKTGTAKLTLTGTNTYTGATTLTAGTLSVGTIGNGGVSGNMGSASNAAANLVFNGGALQYTGATASTDRSFTISAGKTATFDITTNSLTVSGSTTATTGALTKVGSGTLVLSGTNLHTGITTVSAGTLQFAKTASLYNSTSASWTRSNILVSSGATLAFNVGGTGEFTTGNVTTLLSNLTSSLSSNGLMAGATWGFDTTNASGGTFTIADSIADSSGTGGGAVGLTKLGTGKLVLSNGNTYTGTTTVSAGTLQIGAGGTTGALSASSAIVNNGTLAFNRSDTVSQGTHFTSVITGTGTVAQTGSGTVVLSGANSYSGGTVISSGTLLANNSTGSATGSGALTVAAGTVLGGTGYVNAGSNAITINGTLTIGDTTLSTAVRTDFDLKTTGGSGITLGSTGSMRFDLFSGAGAGDNTASLTASDLLVLYGDISLLSGASLIIDNPNNMNAWAIGDQWKLWDVSNAGTRTGSFALASIIAPSLSGYQAWSFDTNTGILSIVPEPGRACLLLLGFVLMGMRRRR